MELTLEMLAYLFAHLLFISPSFLVEHHQRKKISVANRPHIRTQQYQEELTGSGKLTELYSF